MRSHAKFIAFLLLLCGLRILAVLALWEPGTTLEEFQTGSYAEKILTTGAIPIEFRFTNLVAALGFWLFDYNLIGLRAGFIALGLISLVVFAISLRTIGIPWVASLSVLVPIAASPFLSNISFLADESCIGAAFSLIAISCLLIFANKPPSSLVRHIVFTLMFGVLSGVLLFEYTGYKPLFAVLFAGVCLYAGTSILKRDGWLIRIVYCLGILLIAWPQLLEVTQSTEHASFFDSVRRHMIERETLLSAHASTHAWETASILAGFSRGDHRIVPNEGTMLPMLYGVAGILSLGFSFFQRKVRGLALLSLHALIVIAGFILLPNNFEPVKLAPALLSISVCVLALALWVFGTVIPWISRETARTTFSYGIAILWCGVILFHTRATIVLARDDQSRREFYSSDEYLPCLGIKTLSKVPHHRILMLSPRNNVRCEAGSETAWVNSGATHIEKVERFPPPDELPSCTYLMLVDSWELRNEDLALLEPYLEEATTLKYYSLTGRMIVAATQIHCVSQDEG